MARGQGWRSDSSAVSPVIGVILMVAITVVLAAVVFVLVSNLSKNSNTTAPNVTFSQDQTAHRLTIVSADASASWANIRQTTTASGGTCTVLYAGTTTVTSGSTVATTAISAGDFITVGHSGTGSCTISLTYTTVNQLLGTWTFNF